MNNQLILLLDTKQKYKRIAELKRKLMSWNIHLRCMRWLTRIITKYGGKDWCL